MTTRPKAAALRTKHLHHVIWGIACGCLTIIALMAWLSSQSLSQKVSALETQIAQQTATCTAENTWQAGTTKQFAVTTSGTPRTYAAHLPTSFVATNYYPLIMYFTGKGAPVAASERDSGLDTLPAIIIYPSPTIGKDGYLSWQGAPYSSGSNDVQFVNDILEHVESQLCINRDHIYATGMSNGGGMVSLLSCQLPGRFAAYGIVAGAFYAPTGDCTPRQPTPLINIHSINDSIVPYGGSVTRKLPQIDEWVIARAKSNDCDTFPSIEYTSVTTRVTTWNGCRGNATIENVRLSGVGHIWLPSTAQTLWQFFSQHSR